MEAIADQTFVNKDRNMKVCEVCGALQSAVDTDKRLTMHLEGKLHTGYLKIRNKVAELKKRQVERRKGRSRSRSRSPRRRRDKQNEELEEKYEDRVYYSSKKLGSGANMPRTDMSCIMFVKMAM